MAKDPTRTRQGDVPNGEDDPGSRTQDQRGRTGRMVADPPSLESGSESAIDDAIRGRREAGDEDQDSGVDAVQDGESVEDLRRQLRRERQQREAAESRSSELEGRTADALDSASVANLNTLKTAKAQIETEQASLRAQYAQAHAEGDFNTIAEVNQKITNAAVQMASIENGIIALEQQPKQREALARRGEPGNPKFEQITKGMAPVAKQWFRDNPEYYQDDRMLKRLVAAVDLVMTDDDAPVENSPEYFERVEDELGRRDPKFRAGGRSGDDGGDNGGGQRGQRMRDRDEDDDDDVRSGAAGGRGRQVDRPSGGAPVTRNGRGAGGTNTGGGREHRATAAEIEAAEIANIPIEEYLKNKRELVREDRIGPNARNRNQMH